MIDYQRDSTESIIIIIVIITIYYYYDPQTIYTFDSILIIIIITAMISPISFLFIFLSACGTDPTSKCPFRTQQTQRGSTSVAIVLMRPLSFSCSRGIS